MGAYNEQDEIEKLVELRRAYSMKKTDLQLQEVKLSDPNSLYGLKIEIKELSEKIKEVDLEIDALQIQQSGLSSSVLPDNDDEILQALEILKQETKELGYSSNKEDLEKFHALRSRIYESLFKEADKQLNFVVSRNELMYSSALFDNIYANEILDSMTIIEISKIREGYDNYKWYDRSVIVSAISLSLINFKFDAKKANLLLDFITDFEPGVWEKALTGLMLAILSQKNRSWMRCGGQYFLNRLENLRSLDEIQEGIKQIDFILKYELYKSIYVNGNLYKSKLFDNPISFFVPFYHGNDVLKNSIHETSSEINIDEFEKYVYDLPFLDSYKYGLCIGLANNKLMKTTIQISKKPDLYNSIVLSNRFSPFQNIVGDFYCFFKYFSRERDNSIFEKQLLLAKTELKDYVLNKVTQFLIEANDLLNSNKIPETIAKIQNVLKIDPQNIEALLTLAQCYKKKKKYKKELEVYLELKKESKNVNSKFLYKIAICYQNLGDHLKSIHYCKEIEKQKSKLNFDDLILFSENYYELMETEKSIYYLNEAEKLAKSNEEYSSLALGYIFNDKLSDAGRVLNSIPKEEIYKDAHLLKTFGLLHSELLNWDIALDAIQKSIKLERADFNTKLVLARIKIFWQNDTHGAKKIIDNLLKSHPKLKDILYGNIGHLHLVEKNYSKALENYQISLKSHQNKEEFIHRMNLDFKFMVNLGISQSEYQSILEETLKHNAV